MTSNDIERFIESRDGELSSDEILDIIDVSRNPQLNHIIYDSGYWQAWDNQGYCFTFKLRKW